MRAAGLPRGRGPRAAGWHPASAPARSALRRCFPATMAHWISSLVMSPNALPYAHAQRMTGFRLHVALVAAAALACTAAAAPFQTAGGFSAGEKARGYRDGVVLAKPRAEMLATIDRVERGEGLVPRAQFD